MSELSSRLISFGAFELDLRAGELRKSGSKITLQEQPLQVLLLLLEHPGQIVTREELRKRLWPADTFVDFDSGLDTAIKKIRTALSDSADNPRFVETLPKRGYRFIGSCEVPPRRLDETGSRYQQPRRVAAMHIDSVAVLPLQNLSGDPAQEYFADGITEALTTNLAKIRTLRVISRTSAMHYKDTHKTLPEIGKELEIDGVVEGAVVRSRDRVRVTAQLVHAPSDSHVWADSYERDLRDVLSLQNEVALAIASEIQVQLTPQEQAHLASARPTAPAVYDAYLKGRFFWNKRSEEGLMKAIAYFGQAIQEDAGYAQAYAGLADCYAMLGWNSFFPPNECLHKAKGFALQALEIDDKLAEAHCSLAIARLFCDWDWSGAESEFKRALEFNPNYAMAHQWCAFELGALGRHVEAFAEARRASRLDPLSLSVNTTVAFSLYLARQYDQVIDQCRNTLDMDPNFSPAHFVLGSAYEQKGNYEEAVAAFQTAMTLSPGNAANSAALAHVYARSDKRDEARKLLGELQEISRRRYCSAHSTAVVYLGLGQREEALDGLEKAYAEHATWLIFLKVDPVFDTLHAHPRFKDLLRRIGLPP